MLRISRILWSSSLAAATHDIQTIFSVNGFSSGKTRIIRFPLAFSFDNTVPGTLRMFNPLEADTHWLHTRWPAG